jgi:hypothetical protein
MKKMSKFIAGQTLWFVYYKSYSLRPRPDCEVTVTKVGREWLALSNRHRVDKHTLIADGKNYSPPGRCYLSREIYEKRMATLKAWRDFSSSIDPRNPPDGVELESIAQAIRLLNLPMLWFVLRMN